jgi:transposase
MTPQLKSIGLGEKSVKRFAVDALLASASVGQACELLGIGWDTAHDIMGRAVERGWERRQLEGQKHLGIDEKSLERGQSYFSAADRFGAIPRGGCGGRSNQPDGHQLWQTLTAEQKEAVAVDT